MVAPSAARSRDNESVEGKWRRQREGQEREAKEAREALEKQITERNRRVGWGWAFAYRNVMEF
jgi:hypothetical protein